MKHLKDNNVTYFQHMAMSLTLAKFGLKILFFGIVHAILPNVFQDASGKTIKDAHRVFVKMKREANINFYKS